MINRLLLFPIGVSIHYYFTYIYDDSTQKTEPRGELQKVNIYSRSRNLMKFLGIEMLEFDFVDRQKKFLDVEKVLECDSVNKSCELLFEDTQEDLEGPYLSSTQNSLYWASHTNGVMKRNLTSGDISVLVPAKEEEFVPHSVVFDEENEMFYMTSELFDNKGSIFKYDPLKNGLEFLNAPNDLVLVSSNTTSKIYFTDPFWFSREIRSTLKNLSLSAILGLWKRKSGLYVHDLKTNETELVYDFGSLFAQPNGVTVDKTQNQLFVTLTGKTQLVVFDIIGDSLRYRETFDLKNQYPTIKYKNSKDSGDAIEKVTPSFRPLVFLDGMTVYKDYLLIATCQDFIIVKSISETKTKNDFILDLSLTGIKEVNNLVFDELDETLYVTEGAGCDPYRLWKLDLKGALSNLFP
eukprot:CAMPEP_0178943360 /NCGR_PEP_ID=MMETSP0789-20121207/2543_1 /TAXON_ID=3005 /ORGANISM="Rhizosolenia setigera, Strain CCMP 1694" /LENGTH=406 /DNA_ID=CAMNT_0020622945 /DNA_START=339 /DNA_END=1561 /DNA_ORIENTATION=+